MLLKTRRLLLRDFVLSDETAIHAYQSEPRFLKFYPWDQRTRRQTRAFVRMCASWAREKPRVKFQLVAVSRSSGDLVGNCGLRKQAAADRVADLGYELAPRVWGQGLATEAAEALIDWGFSELGLERIVARCVADNLASRRVLEKSGFMLAHHVPAGVDQGVNWSERLEYVREQS